MNKMNAIGCSLLILMLQGCSLFHQNNHDYRYVDNGNVKIITAKTYETFDSNIKDFPIYGAFSKSVYLDEKTAPKTETLDEFCKGKDAIYRPAEWTKLTNLQILTDRKKAHEQLKLEIEVFTKKSDDKSSTTAMIVFRGTDFDESKDWMSNLRWFTRWFTSDLDQYDEVRVMMPKLIKQIENQDNTVNKFITTGHSLGGGLAQLAGYASHKIDTVYSFDSSPVTGYFDVEGGLRRFNAQNLKIYRIYEHGEVVAYLRLALKAIVPVSEKHPDIVQVRFNVIHDEDIIAQHDIKTLTCNLQKDLDGNEGDSVAIFIEK